MDDRLHEYGEFEINVTQRCNAVCEFCDRLVGVVNIRNTDVTADQVRQMVEVMQRVGYRPRRINIAGGEPYVNKELNGIIEAVEPLKRNVVVLTNCVTEYKLPKQKNGKRIWFRHAALEEKDHVPFLVSPKDLGITDYRRSCAIQKKCGIAFDAFGFSMCPVAASLGHVLRINPYRQTPTHDRIMEICDHCPHTLKKDSRLNMYNAVRNGEVIYPTKTLQEGLERFAQDPIAFPRFGEQRQPPKPAKTRLPIIQPTGYRAKGVKLPTKFVKGEHDVFQNEDGAGRSAVAEEASAAESR